jgi:outer membrane protein assembly factor BamB
MDLHQHLIKFARADGATRYIASIPNVSDAADVAVVRGIVVIAALGPLIGVDTANGAVRWILSDAGDQFGFMAGTFDDSLYYPSKYKGLGEISAIDPRDGSRRWTSSVLPPDTNLTTADQVRIFGPNVSGSSLAASFVIWKGGERYNRGGVALLDARTGARRWSQMLPVKNAAMNTIPERAAVGNGAVVVGSYEGYVYCFDEQTGALRWTGVSAYEAHGERTSAPDDRVIAISGQVAVAGSGSHGFTGYDLATGRVLWNSMPEDTGDVYKLMNAPNGRVLARHLAGQVSMLNASNGKPVWVRTAGRDENRINGLRVAGDTVFGTSIVGGLRAWRLPP